MLMKPLILSLLFLGYFPVVCAEDIRVACLGNSITDFLNSHLFPNQFSGNVPC